MIAEALDDERCSPDVLAGVEAAAGALEAAGAAVERVSIPLWRSGFAIWFGVLVAGWPPMLRSNGIGNDHLGYVDVERAHAAGLVRRTELDQLPPTIKLPLLLHRYLDERYRESRSPGPGTSGSRFAGRSTGRSPTTTCCSHRPCRTRRVRCRRSG